MTELSSSVLKNNLVRHTIVYFYYGKKYNNSVEGTVCFLISTFNKM